MYSLSECCDDTGYLLKRLEKRIGCHSAGNGVTLSTAWMLRDWNARLAVQLW